MNCACCSGCCVNCGCGCGCDVGICIGTAVVPLLVGVSTGCSVLVGIRVGIVVSVVVGWTLGAILVTISAVGDWVVIVLSLTMASSVPLLGLSRILSDNDSVVGSISEGIVGFLVVSIGIDGIESVFESALLVGLSRILSANEFCCGTMVGSIDGKKDRPMEGDTVGVEVGLIESVESVVFGVVSLSSIPLLIRTTTLAIGVLSLFVDVSFVFLLLLGVLLLVFGIKDDK
jgi:hypothetical protein